MEKPQSNDKRWFVSVAAALAGFALCVPGLWAQDNAQGDLAERVQQAVKDLDAPSSQLRVQAQERLIGLGTGAIPLLPEPDAPGLSAEQKRRLEIVRAALDRALSQEVLAPTTLTLDADNITLQDLIAQIQQQTGNQIVDFREPFNQEVTNPELAVNWDKMEFWKAMDEVHQKTGIGPYLYTGKSFLGLLVQPRPAMPTCYAGPVRIAVKRLVRSNNFESGERKCSIGLELAWEPRLRPILFELNPDDVEVIDDKGRRIKARVPNATPEQQQDEGAAVARMPVNETMVSGDFVFDLDPPEVYAEALKTIKGAFQVVVPGEMKTFTFGKLEGAKNVQKEAPQLKVILQVFDDLGDGRWSADILLEFDARGSAFESYQTWFFDNECYLQRADGTRFALNGGSSLTESSEGRVGLQYRFVDAPGKLADYRLVYRTPASIVRRPVRFELKDLILP